MQVVEIIKSVRCCIDEEAVDSANLNGASAYDFDDTTTDVGLMNNIIKSRIGDALRWVCLYAPSEMLSGSSDSSSSSSDSSSSSSEDDYDIIKEETNKTVETDTHYLKPEATLIRVIRVRGKGWSRAVLGESILKEDSDEYLQLTDGHGAAATKDRPQAAIINTKAKKVEVWPVESGDTFELTYITQLSVDTSELEDSTDVNVPAGVQTSFIYYLAYLLLSAYGDARARNMFEIATMNLGKSEDKQRQ